MKRFLNPLNLSNVSIWKGPMEFFFYERQNLEGDWINLQCIKQTNQI